MTDLDARAATWFDALETRHLADLTMAEAARALRALSSCYVERRDKLASGGALESAGKRAAFALFYSPLHYLVVREVLASLPGAPHGIRAITDLGCGTGAAGIAWALAADGAGTTGIDRHPWAVSEANWAYRAVGVRGRAYQRDVAAMRLDAKPGAAIVAAYAINEVPAATRESLLGRLIDAHDHRTRILIVEPIARRTTPWWRAWESAFAERGGRADEWRFPIALPPLQRKLARAAGLDHREMTARSLYLA